MIFGFSGVLFLINPFAEQTGTLSLIGIIAGLAMPFFAALMFIFLRRQRSKAAISTTLWYNGVGTLLFAVIMLGTNASFPGDDSREQLYLVCANLCRGGILFNNS